MVRRLLSWRGEKLQEGAAGCWQCGNETVRPAKKSRGTAGMALQETVLVEQFTRTLPPRGGV